MKKNILFIVFIMNTLTNIILFSCPCEFSPDDKRPFFEQYDMEIIITPQEKEKKS